MPGLRRPFQSPLGYTLVMNVLGPTFIGNHLAGRLVPGVAGYRKTRWVSRYSRGRHAYLNQIGSADIERQRNDSCGHLFNDASGAARR